LKKTCRAGGGGRQLIEGDKAMIIGGDIGYLVPLQPNYWGRACSPSPLDLRPYFHYVNVSHATPCFTVFHFSFTMLVMFPLASVGFTNVFMTISLFHCFTQYVSYISPCVTASLHHRVIFILVYLLCFTAFILPFTVLLYFRA